MTQRSIVQLVLILMLSGCAPTAEHTFEDYRTRLERVSRLDANLQFPATPHYPDRRDREKPLLESERINLIEYFSLRDCALFALLSERNSILGRVMPPSRRLAYELEFLQQAQVCQRQHLDQGDGETAATLAQIIEHKRGQLGAVLWAATFDSDELAQSFSPSRPPYGPDEFNSAGLAALERLLSQLPALRSEATLDVARFERALKALADLRHGGRLLRSAALASAYMQALAELVHKASYDERLCRRGQALEAGRIMHNVFNVMYVQRLQAWLSELNRQGQQWRAGIAALESVQEKPLPSAYRDYRQRSEALWKQLDQAIVAHAKAWQGLFERCGIAVGRG